LRHTAGPEKGGSFVSFKLVTRTPGTGTAVSFPTKVNIQLGESALGPVKTADVLATVLFGKKKSTPVRKTPENQYGYYWARWTWIRED
jgi:hypothetical protein